MLALTGTCFIAFVWLALLGFPEKYVLASNGIVFVQFKTLGIVASILLGPEHMSGFSASHFYQQADALFLSHDCLLKNTQICTLQICKSIIFTALKHACDT